MKYIQMTKEEYLEFKLPSIKTDFNINCILKDNLNILDRFFLLFVRVQVMKKDFGFGCIPIVKFKEYKGKKHLIDYIEGSTKELL